jgi:hypothetical protein
LIACHRSSSIACLFAPLSPTAGLAQFAQPRKPTKPNDPRSPDALTYERFPHLNVLAETASKLSMIVLKPKANITVRDCAVRFPAAGERARPGSFDP